VFSVWIGCPFLSWGSRAVLQGEESPVNYTKECWKGQSITLPCLLLWDIWSIHIMQ